MNLFPYSRQWIDEEDINEVIKVLRSDFITQGPKIPEFENKLTEYCGAKYAVLFNSGTSALHGAYFALGLKGGDEFITTPNTFVATSNAGLYLGAKPVFVDIEKDTGNINVSKIEEKITQKTKLIVPVHYAGHPVNMGKIYNLAQKYRISVIEDACHALGARYRVQKLARPASQSEAGEVRDQNKDEKSKNWIKVGSCRYSDMTVFSFHPVKHITTGEGGAVLTNNTDYYEKLLMFREHGITKKDFINEPRGDWYYEMHFLGHNYRITDMQAALGISQLKKLDSFIVRRREIANTYNEAFKGNPYFDIPREKDYAYSSYHLYPIRLKDSYKDRKRKIFLKLKKKGLVVQVHYIPVYLQPYYQRLGYSKGLCPMADDFYQKEISIPIYPAMSNSDVSYVIENIFETFKNYK